MRGALNKHFDELTTGIVLEFTWFVKKLIVGARQTKYRDNDMGFVNNMVVVIGREHITNAFEQGRCNYFGHN